MSWNPGDPPITVQEALAGGHDNPDAVGHAFNTLACEIVRLKRELASWRETYVDDDGITWVRPTAWAYFALCRAHHALEEKYRAPRPRTCNEGQLCFCDCHEGK